MLFYFPIIICFDYNIDDKLHVLFLGDCGRSAWVNKKNILPYNGKREYNALCESVLKNPKVNEIYIQNVRNQLIHSISFPQQLSNTELQKKKKLYHIPKVNEKIYSAFVEVELMEQIRTKYRLYFHNEVLFPQM